MSDLILCETCSRHIRRDEARCPFCGASVRAETRAASPRVARTGMSRARLYAFHAAVATGVAACGAKTGADVAAMPDGSGPASTSGATTAGNGNGNGGEQSAASSSSGSNPGAVAQSDASSSGTLQLVGPDAAAGTDSSTITDAAAMRDWGPIPLPYGSVFPADCDDDVTV